jgi:hypothetical protein
MLQNEIGKDIKSLSPIYHYSKVKVFETLTEMSNVKGKIYQKSNFFNMSKIICAAPYKPISKSINNEV